MMANEMLRIETLFLIASISLLTVLLYPTLIPSFSISLPKFDAGQFQPAVKESIYMRNFYDIEEWFRNVKPQFSGKSIVHGIRKPHPPQRSPRLQQLNLFHEVLQRRPWPRFSPGARRKTPRDGLFNVPSPSPSVPSLKDIRSYSKLSGYLVKNLYRGGHEWSHPELCNKNASEEKTSDIQLLIIAMSPPLNHKARAAIRRTWGNDARKNGVVLAFLLGRPSAKKLDDLVQEDYIYGDLILNHMRESHINTTLKTISLLEWIEANCPRAQFVLKTNDDVFINVPRLLGTITAMNRKNGTKTIWGEVMKNIRPERESPSSPYYLSLKEYPKEVLPDFVLGAAYLLSSEAIPPLFRMAPDLPFLRLDDVFVTGLIANAAGVQRVHVDDFFKYNAPRITCDIQTAISFNNVRHRDMLQLWQKIQQCKMVKMQIVASNMTRIT